MNKCNRKNYILKRISPYHSDIFAVFLSNIKIYIVINLYLGEFTGRFTSKRKCFLLEKDDYLSTSFKGFPGEGAGGVILAFIHFLNKESSTILTLTRRDISASVEYEQNRG